MEIGDKVICLVDIDKVKANETGIIVNFDDGHIVFRSDSGYYILIRINSHDYGLIYDDNFNEVIGQGLFTKPDLRPIETNKDYWIDLDYEDYECWTKKSEYE